MLPVPTRAAEATQNACQAERPDHYFAQGGIKLKAMEK